MAEEEFSEAEKEKILDVAETDFDFSSDAAAEESIKKFIKENFREVLGEKVELVDEPDGFTKLQKAFQEEIQDAGENLRGNISKLMKLISNLKT